MVKKCFSLCAILQIGKFLLSRGNSMHSSPKQPLPSFQVWAADLIIVLYSLLERQGTLTFSKKKKKKKKQKIDHPAAHSTLFAIYQALQKKTMSLLPMFGMRPVRFLFKQVTLYKIQWRRPLRPTCWWWGLRNIPQGIIIRQDYQKGYIINQGLCSYSYQCYQDNEYHLRM